MLVGIERNRDGARQTGSPSDPAGNVKTWRGSCVLVMQTGIFISFISYAQVIDRKQ